MKHVIFVLLVWLLSACYAVMPVADEKVDDSQRVIVYYDAARGSAAIDSFIAGQQIEVLYRYTHTKGYALKLKNKKQRKALERVDGVLSVQDDEMVELQ